MKIIINKSQVGKRIHEIRGNMKLNLEDFGKIFNAEKSNVSKWERGLSLPNRTRLEKIAKLGDMSVNELLYGSVEEFITENFEELVKRTVEKLDKEKRYKYPTISLTKENLDKFIATEVINNLDINNRITILDYFEKRFTFHFKRLVSDEENLMYHYKELFDTITDGFEDFSKDRQKLLLSIFGGMYEKVLDNIDEISDEENERYLQRILDDLDLYFNNKRY